MASCGKDPLCHRSRLRWHSGSWASNADGTASVQASGPKVTTERPGIRGQQAEHRCPTRLTDQNR
jgi:hypothetical protein